MSVAGEPHDASREPRALLHQGDGLAHLVGGVFVAGPFGSSDAVGEGGPGLVLAAQSEEHVGPLGMRGGVVGVEIADPGELSDRFFLHALLDVLHGQSEAEEQVVRLGGQHLLDLLDSWHRRGDLRKE